MSKTEVIIFYSKPVSFQCLQVKGTTIYLLAIKPRTWESFLSLLLYPQDIIHYTVLSIQPIKYTSNIHSVQFSSGRSVVSDSATLRTAACQGPCLSPTSRVYSNSCPLSQWCHLTISSSVVSFSSRLQSFPASVFANESALCLRWPKYQLAKDYTVLSIQPTKYIWMYSESWTIKKAERWRIDAYELWCWRRLLRVPWTARRSNQSILKEISPECSLEGLMLKLKLQYFGHLMQRTDSSEKTLMLGKKTLGVGDGQGGLACSSPWDHKESNMTERLNWNTSVAFPNSAYHPPHPTYHLISHMYHTYTRA